MVIRRVGVFSSGKVMAVLYALMGLLGGAFASISAVLSGAGQAGIAGYFMMGMVVIAPILGAIMGFIGGMISALIYNLAASLVGGMTLEVE